VYREESIMDFKEMRILAGIEEPSYDDLELDRSAPHVARLKQYHDIVEEQLLKNKRKQTRSRRRFTKTELENQHLRREIERLRLENKELREHTNRQTESRRSLNRPLFDDQGNFDIGTMPWELGLNANRSTPTIERKRGGAGQKVLGLAERLQKAKTRPARLQTPEDFKQRLPGSRAPSRHTPAEETAFVLPGPPLEAEIPTPISRSKPELTDPSPRFVHALEEAGPVQEHKPTKADYIKTRFESIFDETA
jgi:hypothetical protein